MNTEQVDLIIIGGGPAGLYASFYAGLRDLRVKLFEAKEELGGKLNFYPEKIVWDVGALPPSKGAVIRKNLIQQATLFDAKIYTNCKIEQIQKVGSSFLVTDCTGKTHQARSILFTVGGGIVQPLKLDIPIDIDVEQHIFYNFPGYQRIKGKHLIVSGGGDAAFDYANECLNWAEKVTVIYRGKQLKTHEKTSKTFLSNGGNLLLETQLAAVRKGKQKKLELITEKGSLSADYLLVQHGHQRDAIFLDQLSFKMKRKDDFYLDCEEPTKTSISGCFAAGDIQYSKGKVYLLAGAFQEAVHSINQIKQFLNPESMAFGQVSSHNHKFDTLNQTLLK